MKKIKRTSGIIAVVLFTLAYFGKMNHLPGSAMAFMITFVVVNIVFLPVQLILDFRKPGKPYFKLYYLIRFVTFFIMFSGFTFKLMHFPGAAILFKTSHILLPTYLIIYVIRRWKYDTVFKLTHDDFVIMVLAMVIFSFIERVRIPGNVMQSVIEQEQHISTINAGIKTANEMLYKSVSSVSVNNENKNIIEAIKFIHQKSDSLKLYFDEFRTQLILNVKRISEEDMARMPRRRLVYNLSIEDCETYLFRHNTNGSPTPYSALEIKAVVNNYSQFLKNTLDNLNITYSNVGIGLETKSSLNFLGEEESWEQYMFGNKLLINAITSVTFIENFARLSEHNSINLLLSQLDMSAESQLIQEMAQKQAANVIENNKQALLNLKQKEALQKLELDKKNSELKQQTTLTVASFIGIAFVIILLIVSTRAFVLKQKDAKKLTKQKKEILEKNEELNQQNEEIAAQRDEIETQRDMVTEQKNLIEKTHHEISQSIDYAKRIQISVLSNPKILKERFTDYFVMLEPKDKVSGDFYWWTHIENHTIVTAADCTGHGVPGAFMSMLGISFLRDIVTKEYITHPGVILRRLRKEIIKTLKQEGIEGEQKDGMDIALISIDHETNICQFAGAYNPLYLIRNGEFIEYKADKMPIAIHMRMDAFQTHEIPLEKGDQLYMFSDGFADQFGGPDGKKFKYKPFKDLLLQNALLPMQQQKAILEQTFRDWKGNNEQIDDVVILGLKI